jgi:hypothetical protein
MPARGTGRSRSNSFVGEVDVQESRVRADEQGMDPRAGRDLLQLDGHVVSPELVLVDPALAEQARGWLHRGDDTLARLERVLAARRIAASKARGLEQAQPDLPHPPKRTERAPRVLIRIALASSAAMLAAAAVLVGVRVDVKGDPAVAGPDTTAASAPTGVHTVPKPVTGSGRTAPTGTARTPKREQSRARPQATAPIGTRNFAWAPVAGASGYHVEFFLGSSLVFSTDTIRPSIALPATWRLAGRTRSLVPGEYRWYVWALVSGKRAPQATVRAELVVGA